ncbi:carboxypeptidase regulatory-like domain-containing protein [Spirosoma sp.]|uniref:carboxypeptidase regulatory-like domain-containing protein n=1 Tax=Spirosoma sp. TaxID=1899569 RepID=UPI00262AC51B|nr:carboxypeptidase regulatory-like domain-containing protein [Spirosoma sp.]MCX6214346.1 carboxypeptidase-like regulatory domain-containing protein [Spirosoma sp.]
MNRQLSITWLTTCLLTWLTTITYGQTTTLTGYVSDATTGKPMPFANVYLNGSTRGTTTNEQGYYSLKGVPLGTVEVVASFIGYQPSKRIFRLDNNPDNRVSFRLKPSDQTLATVTVRGNPKKWQQHLRQFKRQLLGEPFGGQCQILNVDALSFHEEDSHLKATASEPLVIENQALGYKIWYDLLHFDGTSKKVYYAGATRFEEIKPTDERQANRFRRNRMRAYQGSTRHLMASLIDSTYEKEGFLVYQEDLVVPIAKNRDNRTTLFGSVNGRLKPLRIKEMIQPGRLPNERRLVSAQPLVVFYTNAQSNYSPYFDARYAYTQIVLPAGQLEMTVDGTVTLPFGAEIQGSLADDRVSTMLPADWTPNPADAESTKINAPVATQGKLMPPDARMNRIARAFNERFQALAPVLFLHTDKPLYATGDRVWLSAYLLDATTNRRPLGETAIHTDLLTASGKLIQHQWLKVEDGRAIGNFRLSDTLASGTYRLRAYTDEDDGQHRPAFDRSIAVYNILQGTGLTRKSVATDTLQKSMDVQLLPEGGRWLVGLPARLGIKIVQPNGHGLAVTGRIVNEQGMEVARFVTSALGMGSVVLTPQNGRKYYAEVQHNGYQQLTPLPSAEPEGFMLAADVVSDTSRLALTILGTSRPAKDSVYVLIQQQGRLVEQRKILLDNGVARVNLPSASLPSGLNQITLYDATARPQAERLVFLPERVPPIKVIVGVNKTRYQPREKVIMSVNLNDDGLPAVAGLSASITDIGQVPDDTAEATIRTHLLLTGELRGHVEQPNWYVTDNSPATRRAVDDLLLTQGWRRVSGTPSTELLGGVSVMGRLLNTKNQPMAGAQVILASTAAGQAFVRSAGADEWGRFRLAGFSIADTLKLVAQITDRQLKNIPGKDVHLVLEGPQTSWLPDTARVLPNWSALRAQLDAARTRQEGDAEFYRDKRVKLLKEVTVRGRRTDDRPEDIQRSSLHKEADAVLLFDDKSPRFFNLYEMIRGRVAGVTVAQSTTSLVGSYQVIIRGIGSLKSSTQPLFLMDGMPIDDADGTALLSFNPADIERIEVLKNGGTAGIYGVRGGNGVIAFYSRRFRPGQSTADDEKAGIKQIQVIGFPSVQREFYVPHYETASADRPGEGQTESSERIDRRDVLYWKPIMQTDSQGHSQLVFPLSDVVRTLRVVVQGITADGRPVVGIHHIRVQ